MLIFLVVVLSPLAVAFFSGVLQAKQIFIDSDDGLRKLALILLLAIALAMMAVVVPHWANREMDGYAPSILFQVLVLFNLVFLVTSKLAAKFGQERNSIWMKSVAASAMLAIPVTLPLVFGLHHFLVAHFNITLTP